MLFRLQLLGALLGLADAGGGDRVGLQVVGRALALAALVAARHAPACARRMPAIALRVVAAARQGADAEAVGLGFVGAGVVDLALRHQAHARWPSPPCAASSPELPPDCLGDHDRAEHRQQDRDAVASARVPPRAARAAWVTCAISCDSTAGDLVLALGGQHQAGIDADVAAERGEGVDLAVPQHEEGEGLRAAGRCGAQAVAEGVAASRRSADLRARSRSGAAARSIIAPYSSCCAGPSSSPAEEPMSGRRFSCAGAQRLATARVRAAASRARRASSWSLGAFRWRGNRQDDGRLPSAGVNRRLIPARPNPARGRHAIAAFRAWAWK